MTSARRWLLGGASLATVIGGGLALFSGGAARWIEKAAPPQGRFIDVDDVRLHYLDVGTGPAIVMIHGLGGQMGDFTYALVDKLKDRYRVIVVERPGSGYSNRGAHSSARLGSQAKTIAEFIQVLGLDSPLVVGHSLGGAVALTVALDHPEHVGGLALIAPLTHPQTTVPPLFNGLVIPFPWLRWIVAWTIAAPAAITQQEPAAKILFGPETPPDDFAGKGAELLSLHPRTFYSASTDLMALGEDLPGLSERYASLDMPVGVVFGTGDRILDPALHGETMVGKIAGLELELIAGGGHMLPVTQPQRTADFIVRIAQRVSPPVAERMRA